ncbi:hypothetical protein L2E82_23204 [Cichorium intybus]|uniref:Uncharacterized protein n=1 Tax=Cichorium intybus TaxID=13427 RepID=A0ACB9DZD0_CICIN|nr:hypothetical protein L2E82_23204 [Cichorium intybus]
MPNENNCNAVILDVAVDARNNQPLGSLGFSPPLNDGPFVGGPSQVEDTVRISNMGQGENLSKLSALVPSGCFGPFPSRLEVPKSGVDNNAKTPSTTDSSKSSVGRIKRRRIRKKDSMDRTNSAIDAGKHNRKPLDLNDNPQVHASCEKTNSTDDSLDSASCEIRATLEIGRKIGFHFENGSAMVEQMIGDGVEKKSNR